MNNYYRLMPIANKSKICLKQTKLKRLIQTLSISVLMILKVRTFRIKVVEIVLIKCSLPSQLQISKRNSDSKINRCRISSRNNKKTTN